jgi:hypothetical protein
MKELPQTASITTGARRERMLYMALASLHKTSKESPKVEFARGCVFVIDFQHAAPKQQCKNESLLNDHSWKLR